MARWVARRLLNPVNANRIAQRVASSLPQVLRALPLRDRTQRLPWRAPRSLESRRFPLPPWLRRYFPCSGRKARPKRLSNGPSALPRGPSWTIGTPSKVTVDTEVLALHSPMGRCDRRRQDREPTGLTQLLGEMRNPAHPWRAELGVSIEKLIHDLAVNPEMYTRGEELKVEILRNPIVLQQVNRLWTEIEARLDSSSEFDRNQISDMIEYALVALGNRMADDEQIHAAVNKWIYKSPPCGASRCPGVPRSAHSSRKSWKNGTPRRLSTGSNCRWDATFNIFESTARWLAGSSALSFSA